MNDHEKRFYRRDEAAHYLRAKYGFATARSLAKLATIAGAGPEFRKAGTAVLYERDALDRWAESRISERTFGCTAAHKVGEAA